MEQATASQPKTAKSGIGTDSKTLADLLPLAAEKYGSAPAARYKDDSGAWRDISYANAGEQARDLALGLIELGVERGDKVAILANTRPEWTIFDFAALSTGATVVPIYQTNSPEECQYVLENSDACAVAVEDAEQLAKIEAVRDQLPHLKHVIIMSGEAAGAISFAELTQMGKSRDLAEWEQRWRAVEPADICTIIYTSGTTGPPKGCVISHGNYRAMVDMSLTEEVLVAGKVVYLFLPLAHSFALLIQLATIDVGSCLAYWERDPLKIVPNLAEVKPDYFPSVPRIFEKIYTAATVGVEEAGGLKKAIFNWAIKVGGEMREVEARGEKPGFLQGAMHVILFYLSVSFTGGLILLLTFFNSRKRLIHDMLIGATVENA